MKKRDFDRAFVETADPGTLGLLFHLATSALCEDPGATAEELAKAVHLENPECLTLLLERTDGELPQYAEHVERIWRRREAAMLEDEETSARQRADDLVAELASDPLLAARVAGDYRVWAKTPKKPKNQKKAH
jgi:hypothetical protein